MTGRSDVQPVVVSIFLASSIYVCCVDSSCSVVPLAYDRGQMVDRGPVDDPPIRGVWRSIRHARMVILGVSRGDICCPGISVAPRSASPSFCPRLLSLVGHCLGAPRWNCDRDWIVYGNQRSKQPRDWWCHRTPVLLFGVSVGIWQPKAAVVTVPQKVNRA